MEKALARIRKDGFKLTLSSGNLNLVVAPIDLLTTSQREFLKRHKAEIIADLKDEQKILDWLAYIEETDPAMIAETLEQCRTDPEAREYFLRRAKETPLPVITCGDCQHFECFNAHGRGAGTCKAGVQPSGNCWWSDTPHSCHRRAL